MIRGSWRPRVDIPEFTRCCFCLPLRHGLLAWGYLKMVGLSILVFVLIEDVMRLVGHSSFGVPAMMVLFICLVLVDLIFNIMFTVAGHMKHPFLYKMYYFYSIVFLVTFLVGYMVVISNYFYSFRYMPYKYLWLTLQSLYVVVPIILVQSYLTLLVRSEARKLGQGSNFQFVNTTTDAIGLNNVEAAVEAQ